MTIVPELQVISFHCDTMYVQSVNVTHCSPQNRCCPKAIIQRISNYKVNVCFNAMILCHSTTVNFNSFFRKLADQGVQPQVLAQERQDSVNDNSTRATGDFISL